MFSNSFIEAEHSVLLFLSSTAIIVTLWRPSSSSSSSSRLLMVAVTAALGRVASAHKGHGQDVLSHLSTATTLVPLLLLCYLHHHLTTTTTTTTTTTMGIVFTYSSILVYWLSQAELGHDDWVATLLRLYIPRVVYMITAVVLLGGSSSGQQVRRGKALVGGG